MYIFRRLDVSEYGAVNSIKILQSEDEDQFMLSGHDEGQIIVWRFQSPSNIVMRKIVNPFLNITWCIDFNSKFIVACSENSKIIVYRSRVLINQNESMLGRFLKHHTAAVTCVNLSEDILVSGSRDKTVIIWRDVTREEEEGASFTMIRVMTGHEEILHYVFQDEDKIYSSDDGGELFIWDKRRAVTGDDDDDLVLRRVDYGEERGAIDCIKMIGSKLFLSYDDFGCIAIQDYW